MKLLEKILIIPAFAVGVCIGLPIAICCALPDIKYSLIDGFKGSFRG